MRDPEQDEEAARVVRDLAGLRTLGQVVAWGVEATPPRKPEAIVAQDEYTHDVVMAYVDGVYAAFDVT